MARDNDDSNQGADSSDGSGDERDMHRLGEEELWKVTQSGNPADRAHAFSVLGMRASERGDFAAAAALHGSEVMAAREIGRDRGLGAALFVQGIALNECGRFDEALEVLEEAQSIYRTCATEEMLADATLMRARALKGLDRIDDAVSGFLNAAAFYEASEQPDWRNVSAVYEAAEALVAADRVDESLSYYEDAQSIAIAVQDSFWLARVRDQQGKAFIRTGLIAEGVSLFRENVTLAKFLSQRDKLMYSRYRYGWALLAWGKPQKALREVETARTFFVEEHNYRRVADIDEVRVGAYFRLGKTKKALKASRRALAYYRSVGDHESAVSHLLAIAETELGGANPSAGVQRLRSLVLECDERKLFETSRIARLRLAEFFIGNGDVNSAVEALNSIPTDRWGSQTLNLASHLVVIARCALARHSYTEATMVAERVLDLASREVLHLQAGWAFAVLAELHERNADRRAASDARRESVVRFLAAEDTELAYEAVASILPSITPIQHPIDRQAEGPEDIATGPVPTLGSQEPRESRESRRMSSDRGSSESPPES